MPNTSRPAVAEASQRCTCPGDGAPLPGLLQACFVVESERFAWWGVENPGAAAIAAGLPPGEQTRLLCALPDRAGQVVVAADVPAVLVTAEAGMEALSRWRSSSPTVGESLQVWARIATAIERGEAVEPLAAQLPTAGHAALALDGTTIWSAAAAVDAARHSVACTSEPAAAPVRAMLRPYQRAGVAWLEAASAQGGGLLADEMGLGKTVQAIAVLATRRAGPHLVVCPTSLLGNWDRELARFAPGLDVASYTGPDRTRVLKRATPGSVVLTSYGVLRSDATSLAQVDWDTVVLDEAQQIKNPDAQAAHAARALSARLRVAMTGTPVENRLDELWSLLAFTNPGLLGSRARFRRRFAVAVEQRRSAAAAQRLQEIVGPHILRRRKIDVAPELPAKIEATVVCTMTSEQEQLYRTSLDEAFNSGLGTGIERRGRVLALLTRLKQICNHPEQAHPTGAPLSGRSGKLDRTTEILTEIVDVGDRALVFTQYRKTGELLVRHLSQELGAGAVPFLHGGLSTSAREDMIAQFSNDPDGPPVLILSLRAAGFGLNLIRATHVVHYDRWWNPAVEDQASDRTHRIGQTRTVTVHTLLTERTLEEAIADLHAGKRDLAGIATGQTRTIENDLARLTDEQLRALLEARTRR
ncbi:MAG: DEAD/DEAH box helicase [Pseudonocardiaceae bacterium]